MEHFSNALYIFGSIFVLLAIAGLQRIFFPHTVINGLMSIEKAKEFWPKAFENKTKIK